MPKPICLVGIGKIAIDQHVPSIAASNDWTLAATVSRSGTVDGVPSYTDFDQMLSDRPDIEVVSLCLPPVPRYDYARKAIAAGRHVMLEKPPGATLAEVMDLNEQAEAAGVTLYTTWHSRMARGVAAAREVLANKSTKSAQITWKEDVRRWHPGQDWVFDPGGMGVFDPGINALSILTEIMPHSFHLTSADLDFPQNKQTPISARLSFSEQISAEFDWLQTGPQTWEIEVETAEGQRVKLIDGGDLCLVDDVPQSQTDLDEYPALYARMFELLERNTSDVDLAPMIHVADALTLGRRHLVDRFDW